jgi:hypothetical protein
MKAESLLFRVFVGCLVLLALYMTIGTNDSISLQGQDVKANASRMSVKGKFGNDYYIGQLVGLSEYGGDVYYQNVAIKPYSKDLLASVSKEGLVYLSYSYMVQVQNHTAPELLIRCDVVNDRYERVGYAYLMVVPVYIGHPESVDCGYHEIVFGGKPYLFAGRMYYDWMMSGR